MLVYAHIKSQYTKNTHKKKKIISNRSYLSLVKKLTSCNKQDIMVMDITKHVKWKCEVPTINPFASL